MPEMLARYPCEKSAMARDQLERDLEAEVARIPLIDPHTHIDPHRPASRTLDDILGYHYYTELAHSAGMDKALLTADADPRDRVRAILYHMSRFDNTVQYSWCLEIARALLGVDGKQLSVADSSRLRDQAETLMGQADW